MSRMFHRVLAASVVGAAALAVPCTALAADSGGGGGAATPTRIAVHLPAHVRPGEPVTVTARIIPQEAAQDTGAGQRPEGRRGKAGGSGNGSGRGAAKGGGHHRGAGHGTGHGVGHGAGHGAGRGSGHGSGHGKNRNRAGHQAVTGEVRFFLDGKAEPPVTVNRDLASEKLQIPLGRHVLVAEYSGDADYLASHSAPVAFELAPGQQDPGLGNPGQDEGPGQGPDGLGPDGPGGPVGPIGSDGPDGPDQGVGQYSPGQYGPGQGDQDQTGPGVDGPGSDAPGAEQPLV